MRCRAVLFDMDGVLVDTEHAIAEFWRELAAEVGCSLSDEELDRHVHGRAADHTLRVLFPVISTDEYPGVLRKMRHNNETQRYIPMAGVLDLLDGLRTGGVPLGLVTGAQRWKADAVVAQLGLGDTFTTQVTAEDVETGKPDPTCYLLAARRLGVSAEECVVFEDAVSGITAAVASGARCVALTAPGRQPQAFAAGATRTARDFQEIAFSARKRELRVDSELVLTFPPVLDNDDALAP